VFIRAVTRVGEASVFSSQNNFSSRKSISNNQIINTLLWMLCRESACIEYSIVVSWRSWRLGG